MKRIANLYYFAVAMVLMLQGIVPAFAKTQIYMAVDGDDRANGRTPDGSDHARGPVRTFDRAIELLRNAKAAQGVVGAPYSIRLAAGIYRIDHTIMLDERDSGYPNAPTQIGPLNGVVKISGGYPLSGRMAGNVWMAHLPSVASGELPQLFIGDQRRLPVSIPDAGLLTGSLRISGDRLTIVLDKPIPLMASSVKGELSALVFIKWTSARFDSVQIDSARRVLTLPALLPSYLAKDNDRVTLKLYTSSNQFLTLGRFATDHNRDVISYRFQPHEEEAVNAMMPIVRTLLKIKGQSQPAKFIEVENLYFSYTSQAINSPIAITSQAEVNQPGAIEIEAASGIRLAQIAVTHTGGAAIVAHGGVSRLAIEGCELADLGAGGILVGDPADRGRGPVSARPQNIVIRGCSIRGFGRIFPGATAIWLGNAAVSVISGNSISDGYYSGISAGWSWGVKGTSLSQVQISGNHVSNIGHGLLSDMGGIYTLGVTSDTQVSGNFIDGVQAGGYGGWGLYADEGTSNILFNDNVVINSSSDPIHLHFANQNIIRHNYLWGGRNGIRCSINGNFTTSEFADNLVVTEKQNPWGWGCLQKGFQIKSDNRIQREVRPSRSDISDLPEVYRYIAAEAGRKEPLLLTRNLPPIQVSF